MKFGDFVIFLCSSQNIWTIVKFELKRYFLTRIFFFLCCAMICWQLKSKTVQKLLTISFFIWQFSAMCCFFWLKILFRYNFDQTFFLFSGCARNTWWAGSSDPKQYRSCRIYRWSIDYRWGRWWKQHPNLNRWSHVHGWKGILIGIVYEFLTFPCFFNFVLWAKNYIAILKGNSWSHLLSLLVLYIWLQRNSDGIFFPEFWFPSEFLTSGYLTLAGDQKWYWHHRKINEAICFIFLPGFQLKDSCRILMPSASLPNRIPNRKVVNLKENNINHLYCGQKSKQHRNSLKFLIGILMASANVPKVSRPL